VPTIFDPLELGKAVMGNRVVMAPMTRNRADDDGVPSPHAVTYYRQRAGAGLIITEATQPSAAGRGYAGTPGLHSDQQQFEWQKISDAVHDEGGLIYLQLMHTGRIGHTSLLPNGRQLLAPSAVIAEMEVATATGEMVPAEMPLEMTASDIQTVIKDFADASERAVAAGLDGIELHGANGYLLHQFLSPHTNRRTDEYGGDAVNRARFVLELTSAVAERIGADRVGLRLSPGGRFNDMHDKGNEETYVTLVRQLNEIGLSYLHTLRGRSTPLHDELRSIWSSVYMVNTGYQGSSERDVINQLVVDGVADCVSVGRLFISNPDLVARWEHSLPLAPWDEDTFYVGADKGYIDYPSASGT
jgi:N-ethylmaleimide reductase